MRPLFLFNYFYEAVTNVVCMSISVRIIYVVLIIVYVVPA
jgi:hypothetical protein